MRTPSGRWSLRIGLSLPKWVTLRRCSSSHHFFELERSMVKIEQSYCCRLQQNLNHQTV